MVGWADSSRFLLTLTRRRSAWMTGQIELQWRAILEHSGRIAVSYADQNDQAPLYFPHHLTGDTNRAPGDSLEQRLHRYSSLVLLTGDFSLAGSVAGPLRLSVL